VVLPISNIAIKSLLSSGPVHTTSMVDPARPSAGAVSVTLVTVVTGTVAGVKSTSFSPCVSDPCALGRTVVVLLLFGPTGEIDISDSTFISGVDEDVGTGAAVFGGGVCNGGTFGGSFDGGAGIPSLDDDDDENSWKQQQQQHRKQSIFLYHPDVS
jgi:hypothetical protein